MAPDAYQSWVGKESVTRDQVTEQLVERFRKTFLPHLAPAALSGSVPLSLQWCLAPDVAGTDQLGSDGHPVKGLFLPDIPLPRRMWAGGEVEFLRPLTIGDHITRRSTIADIRSKSGRSGLLYFVEVRHTYEDPHGDAFIRERQDIVYREDPSVAASPQPVDETSAEARQPDISWQVDASPTLLFRYSALTFNGHRIHYDQPYAMQMEGYAGLVVHGPLQASLLVNLAACLLGRSPDRFSYRGAAALIAGAPFQVCAAMSGGAVECWTQDMDGRVKMRATAS